MQTYNVTVTSTNEDGTQKKKVWVLNNEQFEELAMKLWSILDDMVEVPADEEVLPKPMPLFSTVKKPKAEIIF